MVLFSWTMLVFSGIDGLKRALWMEGGSHIIHSANHHKTIYLFIYTWVKNWMLSLDLYKYMMNYINNRFSIYIIDRVWSQGVTPKLWMISRLMRHIYYRDYWVVCSNFGHPAIISSFTKYRFLQVKNSFSTIVNGLSVLKLFQLSNTDL